MAFESPVPDPGALRKRGRLKNETILVVDDNRQLGSFLTEQLLPSLGYQSRQVFNGATALVEIHNTKPSLLLLDLELPDITGLDLLRQLQQTGISVPTILLTAHGSEQIAADAFRLGVQDYLIKPVDEDHLAEAISRALEESRLRAEKAQLLSELNDQVNRLLTFSKIGQSVTSTLELDEVLRRIVEAGVLLTQADEGFLALVDHDSGNLYLRASKNLNGQITSSLQVPVADSLLGEVLTSGQPMRKITDSSEQLLKIGTGLLVNSLLNVPIFAKGRPLGVLSVDNRQKRQPFSQRDEMLLASLADYAAVALENANLYQQARFEIAERERVEAALRESEERYALAARGANDGIWDFNLKKNSIHLSDRWKEMLGYAKSEIGDNPNEWFNRVHPDDVQSLRQSLNALVNGKIPHLELEYRIRHKNSGYRWMLVRGVAVQDFDGGIERIAGSQTDISDRKEVEARLLHDAFHDKLTGLPNRAMILDHLHKAIQRVHQQPEYTFAVLFLDLDQFKDVNDSLGHPTGDQLLISVAQTLKNALRRSDTVARLGGDEFVILLDGISSGEDAIEKCKEILAILKSPVQLGRHNISITTSIGIVLSSTGYSRPEDVLRDADIAMYAAKNRGKATYLLFNPQMRLEIMERLALEADIQGALEKDQLKVYYQPIISLQEGTLTGFEALVHWLHPQHGLLTAGQFLQLAHETGVILPIDWWVLEAACSQVQVWQARYGLQPPLKASVNFGSSILMHADFRKSTMEVLEKTGLPPQNLLLEIPESIVALNNETVSHVIAELREAEIGVQIDDFGKGYSSLRYLKNLPINALKIDSVFVHQIQEDGQNTEIPRMLINLAHEIGVQTIAEGIEQPAQLRRLRDLGCDFGQGFLFSNPLETSRAEEMIEAMIGRNYKVLSWLRYWSDAPYLR